jgi:hypothetical protein
MAISNNRQNNWSLFALNGPGPFRAHYVPKGDSQKIDRNFVFNTFVYKNQAVLPNNSWVNSPVDN